MLSHLRSIVLKINMTSLQLPFTTKPTTALDTGRFNFDSIFFPENKERAVDELSKIKSDLFVDNFVGESIPRKAAVLIPLCYDLENRPALLFNLRPKSVSRHKGEICFPGGALDPRDNDDVIVAALRETEEELGIRPDDIEIWTTLPCSVPTVISAMRVAPVLGFINTKTITFDPKQQSMISDEVEYAFTVPIEHLCDPKNWASTNVIKSVPRFTSVPEFVNLRGFMEGDGGRIWGVTAIITHTLLTFLVPEAYQREVPVSSGIYKMK